MLHQYRPDLARGDLPLVVYDKIHDLDACPFELLRYRWKQLRDAGVSVAQLGRLDRFYLLTVLLRRRDAFNPWIFARCREVEADPDMHLDLWARGHYKSTIITFAGIIQEVLRDPEITICIFSHTRPHANKFLAQIKREFEHNEPLKETYPEILWAHPHKDAPFWSIEKGISVKRLSNPKEATIEASGLIDSMPIGNHYALRVYDDVVTPKSVSTPEQVTKATEAYQLSDSLGQMGRSMREWMIGTRYTFADTYQTIIDKKSLHVRIHAATDNGLVTGNPVFLSPQAWAAKVAKEPMHILAAQQLQNPAAGTEAMFNINWVKYQDVRPATLNVYLMVDPAGSKKRSSDNTAMSVIGYDAGRVKWLLDGYCHKMGLTERWQRIKELRQKWLETPGVQNVFVGYESYGIPDALDHFEERMEIEKLYFPITVLQWPRQEAGSKEDRIARLEPDLRMGRFVLSALLQVESPAQIAMREAGQAFRIFTPQWRVDQNRARYSINRRFLEELKFFPFAQHDDFIDACSRIYDMDPRPPVLIDERDLEPETYSDGA